MMRLWMLILSLALLGSACAGGAGTAIESDAAFAPEVANAGEPVDVARDVAGAAAGRKVIVQASIDLEVNDPEASMRRLGTVAGDLGGFVAGTDLHRSASLPSVHMTVRVPADRLQAFLDAAADEAVEVRAQAMNTDDITEQYADLDAQLRNLRAYEDELRALLTEVRSRTNATPDDLLDVFERIRSVRGEIEQIEGRLRLYDNLTSLATVEVSLSAAEAAEPIAESWSAGSIFRSAVRGLVGALQRLAAAGIWIVVYVVPLVLIVGLPLLAIWAVVRRRRRAATSSASE